MSKTCENCRWWSPFSYKKRGFCRVSPPVWHKDFDDGLWPKVMRHDWCGKWENLEFEVVKGPSKGQHDSETMTIVAERQQNEH